MCPTLCNPMDCIAHQAPLSFTISQSLLKFMSIESVMPCKHLIFCHPLLFLEREALRHPRIRTPKAPAHRVGLSSTAVPWANRRRQSWGQPSRLLGGLPHAVVPTVRRSRAALPGGFSQPGERHLPCPKGFWARLLSLLCPLGARPSLFSCPARAWRPHVGAPAAFPVPPMLAYQCCEFVGSLDKSWGESLPALLKTLQTFVLEHVTCFAVSDLE